MCSAVRAGAVFLAWPCRKFLRLCWLPVPDRPPSQQENLYSDWQLQKMMISQREERPHTASYWASLPLLPETFPSLSFR